VVHQSSEATAVERARWLAELSTALSEARRLAKELGAAEARIDTAEICARIESARREVESLRFRQIGQADAQLGPEWIKSPPWQQHIDAA
jgi:hypothetical protein